MKYTLVKTLRKIIKYSTLLLPFAYMSFIWYLSSKPSDAVLKTGLPYDLQIKEGLHLVEFAILYILFILALQAAGWLSARSSMMAAIFSILYGFVDECHQYFIPCRSFTIIDLIKDITGVLAAYIIVYHTVFVNKDRKGNKNTES